MQGALTFLGNVITALQGLKVPGFNISFWGLFVTMFGLWLAIGIFQRFFGAIASATLSSGVSEYRKGLSDKRERRKLDKSIKKFGLGSDD